MLFKNIILSYVGKIKKYMADISYSNNIVWPLVSLLFVVLIFAVGTKFSNKFLSFLNINNILSLSGMLAIVAMGSSLVILIGGIDLSAEGIIALSAVFCGLFMKNNRTGIDIGFWAFPISMFVGTCCGFLNGLINTKLKIPSFLTTLGMWYITLGMAILIGGPVVRILDPRFQKLANGSIVYLPNIFIISAILAFILSFVFEKHTVSGRHIFAVGGNEILAKQASINVNSVKLIVFSISGCLYGIAGFFMVSRLNIASPIIGRNVLFPAITSAIIGGTVLSGGIGGTLNACIGAIIFNIIQNGMIIMNINPHVQGAFIGLVLIMVVIFTIDRKKIGIVK